ncbi:hypothetical protein TraAM80_08762 [Trypanosoma rangeli]|uniref:WW domain-containing protein n=1 Tax=Trypanosoma rangeli TaxID=5698 RepID=A0A3R7KNZ4_TRYRA|nr:uncharacterized protein TraAM80_08762 [Trypanosoma rangeli]RNE98441.1 hypothetical protein TraAM80_08762 [Trypanosoma rangeli]|eukprot:RNE98441.1 hypothetical protein TraAM80_08762 [Trypanosoma rangeli]
MSVVLDSVPNDNYEPSEAEIVEYGKWLGMHFPEDKPFLWIAREGLKAPLPEHWKACRSEKGELYYFNFKSGESNWDHPLDEQFRELLKSEKLSPSLQSIANGAKRQHMEVNTEGEAVVEQNEPTEACVYSSGGKSTIRELRTLKLKKELPSDLRLNPKAGGISSSDTSERCLEPIALGKIKGGKGCSILKHTRESVSSETSGGCLSSEKEVFQADLNDKLKQFQDEKLKEHRAAIDEYEMKLKESWHRYQKRQSEEYEKKLISYRDDLERKLIEEKNIIENTYTDNIRKLTEEVEADLKLETKRIRHSLNEKYKREKNNIENEWQEKLEDLRKSKILEFDRLRDANPQALMELKQGADELGEAALSFVDTYKKAQDAFLDNLTSTNASLSKLSEVALSKLIGSARESYDSELNIIKDSFKSEIEDMRQKFLGQIGLYQREYELLLQEKEKYEKEREALTNRRSTLSDNSALGHCVTCAAQWKTQDCQQYPNRERLIEQKGDCIPTNKGDRDQVEKDTVGVRSEKELFESVVADMKEAQRKELEDVKRDLKQRAEEELKATLDEVWRERRHLRLEPSCEDKDEVFSLQGNGNVSPDLKPEKELEKERFTIALSDNTQKDNLTAVLIEALRTVFAGSPFILPAPTSGSAAAVSTCATVSGGVQQTNDKPCSNAASVSIPCETEVKTINSQKDIDGFPVSFQEQKLLLAGEHQRVAEGRRFVDRQRLSLEERRYQLKLAKHQWKQDVRAAKEEGIRACSKRGRLLNNIRLTLENQARGLEHDEAILRDSERWLLMKEQSVYQMEKKISELEEGKGYDTSINSIDTVALMTGFFKPTIVSSGFCSRNLGAVQRVARKKSLNPLYTKTLGQIARRLEEVTSIMNRQQQQRNLPLPYENLPGQRSRQKLSRGTELHISESAAF